MNRAVKVISITAVGLVLLLVFLAIAVNYFFTDERLRTLLVPLAEKHLGRQVSVGEIDLSLFTGIKMENLSIKEADGQENFAAVESFVLHYEFLPLLQKKLVIGSISILRPQIHVSRDSNGRFNYSSLAFLQKEGRDKQSTPNGKAAIPLALTIDTVEVREARFTFQDAKEELPDATGTADLTLGLQLASDFRSMQYDGKLSATADLDYGELTPRITADCRFDHQSIDFTSNLVINKEKLTAKGTVTDYARAPAVQIHLSSDHLKAEHLMAIVDKLPAAKSNPAPGRAKKPQNSRKAERKPAKPSHPPVEGTLQIATLQYRDLNINNLKAEFTVTDMVATITPVNADIAGGSLTAASRVDLNPKDIAYKADIKTEKIMLTPLLQGLRVTSAELVSGGLYLDAKITGAGAQWPQLCDRLDGSGNYALKDGRIKETPISRALAELLGMQELLDLDFEEMKGDFTIADGGLKLQNDLDSRHLTANTKGTLACSGAIDFPLTLKLTKQYSEKLKKQSSLAEYLTDDKGRTQLQLVIKGTLDQPRIGFDEKSVEKQAEGAIRKKIKKEAAEELERVIRKNTKSDKEKQQYKDAAEDLLKGLFGD